MGLPTVSLGVLAVVGAVLLLPARVTGSYGKCICFKEYANKTREDCGCYNADDSGESACAASCMDCVCLADVPQDDGIRHIKPCSCNAYRYELDCFPASASLLLRNGSAVNMDELEIGHSIQAGAHGEHSDVHLFTHRQHDIVGTFVGIHHTHSSSPLLMTGGHYLYANGALKTARQVKVGDVLTTATGSAAVTKIDKAVQARGLYNPHTLTNDLIVNGILVSALTDAVMPKLAHAFLWPARMLYSAGAMNLVGTSFDKGAFHSVAPFIPGGAQDYSTDEQ